MENFTRSQKRLFVPCIASSIIIVTIPIMACQKQSKRCSQLQPTKQRYIVKFGLGPYLKYLLKDEISGSKWVSVLMKIV